MTFWNRIERMSKRLFLSLLQRLAGSGQATAKELTENPPQRILVVRQHDQLGDFLLSTPVFRALRAAYPQAQITVVARSYTADLARHNRYIDGVIEFRDQLRGWTPAYAIDFWRRLRSGHDLAVVLNTVSHSLSSDLIARFSRAPFILGSEHHPFPGFERNFFYNLLAPYRNLPLPQSEKNLDIVRAIGVDTADASEHLTLLSDEKRRAREKLNDLGCDPSVPLVALHPGAGKMLNRWPADRFAETANRLAEIEPLQFLVTWGPAENELGHILLANLKVEAIELHCRDIRELAAVFFHLDLLICNDTGVMHLAAAVETPLVAVFGPTAPEEWKPVGERFVAVRAPDLLCSSVSVEKVVARAHQLLIANRCSTAVVD
ncbi:glycosyltransferase family 9 protein [candidate division KSB1 bacterium]|nr:glycosyltransferase family 9 protein [candidate division KSB1 bacterium]